MSASFSNRLRVTTALTTIFTLSSATAAAYSWTEIIPRIGPLGLTIAINDKGQVAVTNADLSISRANPPSDPTHEQGFILIGSKYTFFSRPGWDNTEPRATANSGRITGFNFNGPSTNLDFSTTAGFIYNHGTNTFTDATPPGSGTWFSATQV
jgi:hypothetical protein